ncbi:hypothetical protein C2869_02270 [Saccharobesus litoralis]|uniref:Lipoprotein n=1 Tax=Saccharobesus litoralis TaxID=2172099 RepID=A0A2S0VM81_9ALTE|nr:hypothetical protein [Saccharobesus litoralis]AWB65337.1 hypothetical protein C2869_02270 [Saccharobesus litoralis]
MRIAKTAVALSAAVLIVSCSSTSKNSASSSAAASNSTQQSAKQKYLNEAREVLDGFKVKLADDSLNDLSYFAPKPLALAKKKFKDAMEEYDDIAKGGGSLLNIFTSEEEEALEAKKEIIKLVATAESELNKAKKIRESAKTILGDVFSRRDYLKQLNVTKIYPKTFQKLNNEIDGMVKDIAEGEIERATKEQAKMSAELLALEVKTVKYIELNELNEQIASYKKAKIDDALPRTFQGLVNARNTADAVISADPRAKEAIKTAVDKVKFEIAHLKHLHKAYKELASTKKTSYELYLIAAENNLHTIASAMQLGDLRNIAMKDQADAIADKANQLLTEVELAKSNAAAKLDSSANAQDKLQQENAALKTELNGVNAKLTKINDELKVLLTEKAGLQSQVKQQQVELIKLKSMNEVLLPLAKKQSNEQQETPQNQVVVVTPAATQAETPVAASQVVEQTQDLKAETEQAKKEVKQLQQAVEDAEEAAAEAIEAAQTAAENAQQATDDAESATEAALKAAESAAAN